MFIGFNVYEIEVTFKSLTQNGKYMQLYYKNTFRHGIIYVPYNQENFLKFVIE